MYSSTSKLGTVSNPGGGQLDWAGQNQSKGPQVAEAKPMHKATIKNPLAKDIVQVPLVQAEGVWQWGF